MRKGIFDRMLEALNASDAPVFLCPDNQWSASLIRSLVEALANEEMAQNGAAMTHAEQMSFAWLQLLAASIPAGRA